MLTDAETSLGVIREQQELADTTPHLIDTLITKRIDGREYVSRLQHETSEPIVILEAS